MNATEEYIRYNAIVKRYTDFFGAGSWPMFGEFPQFSTLDELDNAVSDSIEKRVELVQEYEIGMIL